MPIKLNENGAIIVKDGKVSCSCCEPVVVSSVSIFRAKYIDPCSFFLDGQSAGDYDFHTTRFQQKQFFRERYGPDPLVNKCFGCWRPSSELEGCCVFDTRTETIERKENQSPFTPCESTNTTEVTGDCAPCINASASTPYWSSEITGSREVTAVDELEGADFGDWTHTSVPMYLSPPQGYLSSVAITTFENFYSQDYRMYQQDAYVALKIQFLLPSKLYEWKIEIQEYVGGGTSANNPWTPDENGVQYSEGSFETNSLGEIIDPDGFYDGKTDFNWSYALPSPDEESGGEIWTQLPMVAGRVYRHVGSSYTVNAA